MHVTDIWLAIGLAASIIPTESSGAGYDACDAASQGRLEASTALCDVRKGAVKFTGDVLFQLTGKVNSAEACASLCAGSALEGCEAFTFCPAEENPVEGQLSEPWCLLMKSVTEVSEDRSPFPGKCDSGRPCSAPCTDLDSQLARIYPEVPSRLSSSCDALVSAQPGNCYYSTHDGSSIDTSSIPNVRLVQALCPARCLSCMSGKTQAVIHATAAASRLATIAASAEAWLEEGCSVEKDTVYEAPGAIGNSRYLYIWSVVYSADNCASFCAAREGCVGFTFYNSDSGDFKRLDCVLHNSTQALDAGKRKDPCCESGRPCAARCTNHNLYLSVLMHQAGAKHIQNCEEYLMYQLFKFNVSTCRELPGAEVMEALCSLSCFVRGARNESTPRSLTSSTPTVPPRAVETTTSSVTVIKAVSLSATSFAIRQAEGCIAVLLLSTCVIIRTGTDLGLW